MRIGIFTNNYLPNIYGVPNSIESFRKKFEAKGHSVFIFAPDWGDYQDTNPNVFRYPSIKTNFKFKFPLGISYSFKMNKIIDSLELDIIYAQHPNLLGSAAMKWAKRKKIPLVFTWHTLYDQYANFIPFFSSAFFARWMIKKAVAYANRCDQVIIPTESVRKIIKNWGVTNENIEAISTGVEENLYQNSNRELIRKKFNIAHEDILLVLISRLTEEKNIRFIFKVVEKFLDQNKKAKFLVVGDGYLVPELQKISKGSGIILTGAISEKEIKDYYAAGDIFVYASKSETQGMVITEAMYSGLPIVAVKASGVESLVGDGITGFLVEEKIEDFLEALKKLSDNPELRKIFSENSKKIARDRYTDEVCAEKMLAIYKKLI